jgi:hypothetical protein
MAAADWSALSLYNIRNLPSAGRLLPDRFVPLTKPLKRGWVQGVDELRLIPGSYQTIEKISAVIARSQIVVAQPCRAVPSLPTGFDYVDIAVLDWIAVDGRRQGRGLLPI